MLVLLIKWLKDTFLGKLFYIIIVLFKCIVRKCSINTFFTIIERIHTRSRISLLKTIYVNLRSFSLRTALLMPIVVYKNVEIKSLEGTIKIVNCRVCPLMIQFGVYQGFRSKGTTRINNRGTLIIKGPGKFLKGAEITIFPGAILEIGENFFIGENTTIMASKRITIGAYNCISYNTQICDSDFHYMINVVNRSIKNREKPIRLGDYNWIANNATIKKGVQTPNYITVAGSYAVLAKDYTKDISPFTVLAGNPATAIASGYSRVWKDEKEKIDYLNIFFKNNKENINYELSANEKVEDYTF